MTSPPRPLAALQQWMQSVITHPGGVVYGAATDEAREWLSGEERSVESVIARSQALSAVERLTIYNESYFARLLDCLREEFSVLAAALGEELFDSFALGYLQAHPPRSYTLAELGKRFPEYLAETRPEAEGDWPEFLIDLARLELAVNLVFDGPGCEGELLLDQNQLAGIAPDQWPEARLECVPCLKLLSLRYPVNDCFTAIRRGEAPVIPEPATSFVAVTRRDFRVHRYSLTPASHALLSALMEGATVGAAIEAAAALSLSTDDDLMRDLQQWFFTWTTAGFFRRVAHAGRMKDEG